MHGTKSELSSKNIAYSKNKVSNIPIVLRKNEDKDKYYQFHS